MELITRSAKGFLKMTGIEKPKRIKNKKPKAEYL
jgi:hypothetical protein